MANLPISGLTASASNLAATDVTPVVQTTGVGPVKMTGLQFAGGLLGSTALTGSTVTASKPLFDLTQTWNAGAVTFTGLKFNVTDTASAAASLLLDLQVGGTSRFSVGKNASLIWNVNGNSIAPTATNYIGIFSSNQLAFEVVWAQVGVSATVPFGFKSSNASASALDVILTRRGAANIRLGNADAAAPVAQTLSVQSVVAGTSNTAGANFTITGSQGTGTGAGGSIIFQVAPAGSTGTAQNALATALTIGSDLSLTVQGPIIGPGNTGRFSFLPVSGGVAYGGTNNTNGIAFSSPNGGVNTNLIVHSVGTIGFSSTSNAFGTPDVVFARDAANTLALRNGANAQEQRTYGTYTDASNYRRVAVGMSTAGVGFIRPEGAGTGASGNVIYISGLPTSNPGPGILWNNGGSVAIGT